MIADQIIRNERLGEAIHLKTLPSGLKVYIMPKKYFAKKYVFFATHYGGFASIFKMQDGKTIKMPHGIAHFLEHQIFEDQDNPPFERFASLGANVNAYTGFHTTVYHFETVSDVHKPLEILMDMVQHARISPESVEKEKSVIVQEIKMYSDNPNWQIAQAIRCAMYHKHPLNTDIAGTIDSVQSISIDQLKFCFESFYSPGNMAVFVYGDVEPSELFAYIDQLQVPSFICRQCTPEIIFPDEPLSIVHKKVEIVASVEKNRILLGFKAKPFEDKEQKIKHLAALRVANDLMFGESSAFNEKAYQNGLINEPIDMEVQSGVGYAYVILGAETDEIEKLEKEILETIEKFKKMSFSENDFVRLKRKLIGRYIFSFNSLQSIASNYTFNKMRHDDLFEQLEAYTSLTLEDLDQAIYYFYDEENYTKAYLLKEEK